MTQHKTHAEIAPMQAAITSRSILFRMVLTFPAEHSIQRREEFLRGDRDRFALDREDRSGSGLSDLRGERFDQDLRCVVHDSFPFVSFLQGRASIPHA